MFCTCMEQYKTVLSGASHNGPLPRHNCYVKILTLLFTIQVDADDIKDFREVYALHVVIECPLTFVTGLVNTVMIV